MIAPEHLRWFAMLHPALISRLASRMTAHRAVTIAELYASDANLDDITWIVSTLAGEHADFRRRLRLWSADCVVHALRCLEGTHPADPRLRAAIVAARQFARGALAEMNDAHEDALAAIDVAPDAVARTIARAAAHITREEDKSTGDAAAIAVRDLSGAAWQLDRLVQRFAAHEPDDWPISAPAQGAMRIHQMIRVRDAFSSCARSAQPAPHRSSSP
jgi:hypothetical protein